MKYVGKEAVKLLLLIDSGDSGCSPPSCTSLTFGPLLQDVLCSQVVCFGIYNSFVQSSLMAYLLRNQSHCVQMSLVTSPFAQDWAVKLSLVQAYLF